VALAFKFQNSASAASVGLGTEGADWNPGDLAIVYAFNDAAATAPSLPASGWTNIGSSAGSTAGQRAGYRVLQTGDTTSGTWTNATQTEVIILSGQTTGGTPIGITALDALATNQARWAALSGMQPNSTSWVVLLGGHRTATDMNSVALAGTTNRSPTVNKLAMHTVAATSTWAQTSKTVNATNTSRTIAIEVLAALDVARVSQHPVETLILPDNARARVSQMPIEALIQPDTGQARFSQMVIEVLHANVEPTATPRFQVYIID